MQDYIDNFSEAERGIRLTHIARMVESAASRAGYFNLSDEKIEHNARLWLPRFHQIPTQELEACYLHGAGRGAKSADEFVLYWETKKIADYREKHGDDSLRHLREKAKNAAGPDSETRNAIFAKWQGKALAGVH
jgi:hypothetical protein